MARAAEGGVQIKRTQAPRCFARGLATQGRSPARMEQKAVLRSACRACCHSSRASALRSMQVPFWRGLGKVAEGAARPSLVPAAPLADPRPTLHLSCRPLTPQGHLLAAACADSPGFHIWDVATGAATSVAVGACRRAVCSRPDVAHPPSRNAMQLHARCCRRLAPRPRPQPHPFQPPLAPRPAQRRCACCAGRPAAPTCWLHTRQATSVSGRRR